MSTPGPGDRGRWRPLTEERLALALVGVGGALGALARDGLGRALGPGLLATAVPNLLGALALGVLVEALAAAGAPTLRRVRARLLVGTGFLGAFTTYSALSVGTVVTALDGRSGLAAGYAAGTVVLGLVATGAGVALGGRRRPAAHGGSGPGGPGAPWAG